MTEVMQGHKFDDEDVSHVLYYATSEDTREVVLHESNEGSIIISKEDVIAFANEFELIVFEKDSNL